MQIDWSFLDAVNWTEVAWLSAIALLATLIGRIVKHWFWAAILAGLLFAAAYVFLVYYPHGLTVPGLKTGGVSSSSHAVIMLWEEVEPGQSPTALADPDDVKEPNADTPIALLEANPPPSSPRSLGRDWVAAWVLAGSDVPVERRVPRTVLTSRREVLTHA